MLAKRAADIIAASEKFFLIKNATTNEKINLIENDVGLLASSHY